jgi:hypothetical protein
MGGGGVGGCAVTGAELIYRERQRQIDEEGWTPEHDAEHHNGALAWAAACYAAPQPISRVEFRKGQVAWWEPWPNGWRRPDADRVHQLVKAGALIAAEIDRLQAEAQP